MEMVVMGADMESEAADTTDMETTDLPKWKRVVALVQEEFGERRLAEDSTW